MESKSCFNENTVTWFRNPDTGVLDTYVGSLEGWKRVDPAGLPGYIPTPVYGPYIDLTKYATRRRVGRSVDAVKSGKGTKEDPFVI